MSANRILKEKNLTRQEKLHKQALQSLKPQVDNKTPTTKKRGKGVSLFQKLERDRNNKNLLQKMLQIELKPSNLHPGNLLVNIPPSQGSLNRPYRARELKRIANENLQMMNRLTRVKSSYNRQKLKKDYKQSDYFKLNIRKNAGRVPMSVLKESIKTSTSRPRTSSKLTSLQTNKERPYSSEMRIRRIDLMNTRKQSPLRTERSSPPVDHFDKQFLEEYKKSQENQTAENTRNLKPSFKEDKINTEEQGKDKANESRNMQKLYSQKYEQAKQSNFSSKIEDDSIFQND